MVVALLLLLAAAAGLRYLQMESARSRDQAHAVPRESAGAGERGR